MGRLSFYKRLSLRLRLVALFSLVTLSGVTLVLGAYALGSGTRRVALGLQSRPAATAATPDPYPAASWQRHPNDDDGYSVALPPDWQAVPLDSEDLARYQAEMNSNQAQLAGQLAARVHEQGASGVGLWVAVAAGGAPGDTSTVNIVRQPLEMEMSVQAFARSNQAGLPQDGPPAPLSQYWLNLTAGPALYTQASYLPQGGDEQARLDILQVFLVNGRDGYVVTGVTPSNRVAEFIPIFNGIVRSLRWTRDPVGNPYTPAPAPSYLRPGAGNP